MNPGIDFNINSDIWSEYQKYIIDKNKGKSVKDKTSASKEIEKFMKEELSNKNKSISES